MPTVFLSYAREDIVFARRLHDALVAQGFETWVDWTGIPPADDWQRKIFTAIEACDALVFVMSPDSLASVHCRDEVAHAVDCHKRLLPVVAREPDATSLAAPTVHEAVRRLNWIFFNRPQDDFDAAMHLLAGAVRTDLPWVETHTRLLQRALAWQAAGREDSRLLAGRELAAAEQWLAGAPDKEPAPTRSHSEFIVAGRAAAQRRQRRRTLAASVAAVLVGIGALVATWQYLVAELRRQDAQSRQLAAVAPTLMDEDPALGLRLAAQALSVSPTLEASQALLGVLEAVRGVSAFLPGRFPRGEIDLSPDGRLLVAAGCTRELEGNCAASALELWQVDPPQRLAGLDLPKAVHALAFAADGRSLAALVRGNDGPYHRLQLSIGPSGALAVAADAPLAKGAALPAPFTDAPRELRSAGPQSRILRQVGGEGEGIAADETHLQLWAAGPPARLLGEVNLGLADDKQVRFSADGTLAAGRSCQLTPKLCAGNVLGVIAVEGDRTRTLRLELPWPEWIHDFALFPEAQFVLSGGCGWHDGRRCHFGELRLWQPSAGDDPRNLPRPIRLQGGTVAEMRTSADGRRMALLSDKGLVSLWQLDPRRLRDSGVFDSVLAAPLPTPQASAPASAATRCQGQPVPERLAPVVALLDDPAAVCATLPEVDVLWGDAERGIVGPTSPPRLEVAVSLEGRRFAVGGCVDPAAREGGDCRRGRAAVWAVQAGRLARVAAVDLPAAVQQLALSGNGELLALTHCPQSSQGACEDGRLERVALDRGTPVPVLLAQGLGGTSALALSKDGALVALAGCAKYGSGDGPGICAVARIELRRSDRAAQPLWVGQGHDNGVELLSFDPGATRLISGGEDGTIGLWSVAEGRLIGPVVQAPLKGLVRIDAESSDRMLLQVDPHQDPPQRPAAWPLRPSDWQAAACRMALRPLNDAERQRYLPDSALGDPCGSAEPPLRQRFWRWLRGWMPSS